MNGTSYVSDAEKASYIVAMDNLHATFARDIVVYQTSQKVVVSTNPNHNFIYSSGPNQTQVQETVVKGTYKARIHYPKEESLADLVRLAGGKNNDQVNVKRKDYQVKLLVDLELKNILDKVEKIEFDGTIFSINSDPRPHGVIDVQFWNFYLMALN